MPQRAQYCSGGFSGWNGFWRPTYRQGLKIHALEKAMRLKNCQWPRSASLVPGADDDVRDSQAFQQPVERDMRHRLAGFLRRLIERVHNRLEVLLRHLRPKIGRLVEARTLG